MDTLLEAREEALRDPLKFVEKLQSGQSLNFPAKIAVAEIPDIQWEKYRVNSPVVAKKPETRFKGQVSVLPTSMVKPDPHSEHASRNLDLNLTLNSTCKVEKNPRGQILVRGRIFDDKKPKKTERIYNRF